MGKTVTSMESDSSRRLYPIPCDRPMYSSRSGVKYMDTVSSSLDDPGLIVQLVILVGLINARDKLQIWGDCPIAPVMDEC